MLEQLAAFLVSLAVAAAGLVGADTASTAPHGVGTPEIATAKAALARQAAAERLAAALERAELASEDGEDQDVEVAGADTAGDALTQVIADAPEAAQPGLENAFTRVTGAPTGEPDTDAGDGAPADVPAGPPAEVPAGPPAEVPAGPPADASGGRP